MHNPNHIYNFLHSLIINNFFFKFLQFHSSGLQYAIKDKEDKDKIENLEDAKKQAWVDENISKKQVDILSPFRLAHYNQEAGFFFRCDVGYNLKFKGGGLFSKAGEISKVMFTLCPPAELYTVKDKKEDKKNTFFTLKTDLNTPCCYPKYKGEKQNFHIPYDPKACFIIECKGLKLEKDKKNPDKDKFVVSDLGWSLLPIFQKGEMEDAPGHVICGFFQLPLFDGLPQRKMIHELIESDISAYDLFTRETRNKGKDGKYKLKPADGHGSLLVKLLDTQLYGMAKTFLKDLNTDRYVCFDDKKYNYDKSKHKSDSGLLIKCVPKGKDPKEFEQLLNQRFASKLRLVDAGVELLPVEDDGDGNDDDDKSKKGNKKAKKNKKEDGKKKGAAKEDQNKEKASEESNDDKDDAKGETDKGEVAGK